jgi:hypothetical protein
MRTIRLAFEYHAYPLWILDERGMIYDTALPDELKGNTQLDDELLALQKRFDASYIDTPSEFSSIEWSEDEWERFIVDSNRVFDEVKRLLGPGKYLFEEDGWLKESPKEG